jgi:hypothetical protein
MSDKESTRRGVSSSLYDDDVSAKVHRTADTTVARASALGLRLEPRGKQSQQAAQKWVESNHTWS